MTIGVTQGNFETWTMQAGNNLNSATAGTGALYKAVRNKTGDFASNGREASGILESTCDSGNGATFGYAGPMKCTLGAAISSADTLLSVTTSGYFKAAGSGDWIVGKLLSPVTSGGVSNGIFNFATPTYLSF